MAVAPYHCFRFYSWPFGGGGAVGVVVADHQDVPVVALGFAQQGHGLVETGQLCRCGQVLQRQRHFVQRGNAAPGEDARQQWRQAVEVGQVWDVATAYLRQFQGKLRKLAAVYRVLNPLVGAAVRPRFAPGPALLH